MCWNCKKTVTLENIYRDSACPECRKDLHSCRNCLFYEPGSFHDCKEACEELVADKEKSNFCEAFSIKREWGGNNGMTFADKKALDAKNAFEALFREPLKTSVFRGNFENAML